MAITTLDQLKTSLQATKVYIDNTINSATQRCTYTLTATDKEEIAGMVLPILPSVDGSYILTVTISNGNPTYAWQLQS